MQALRGALAAGREKEGELATTILGFEYLRRQSQCEMLISGDGISYDVFTLGACFQVFFNVCLHSRSFPLHADWRKSDSSVDRGIGGEIQIPKGDVVPSSPFFPAPPPERPGEFARSLASPLDTVTTSK